jgi:hypothetical protein
MIMTQNYGAGSNKKAVNPFLPKIILFHENIDEFKYFSIYLRGKNPGLLNGRFHVMR